MAPTIKRPALLPVPEHRRPRTPLTAPRRAGDSPTASPPDREARPELDQDRAYAELLQEVRVAQTSVQILLGFVVFRCGMRATLVTVSNRLALVGLVLLMMAMSSPHSWRP
ncbi:DUF6328 family protein [Streptomyces sp. NBC_00190]|uniref:DUF6328 family protein n=1 Tax=unclassified Streptomyces TaxID=2593676 RepID=UPI002E2B1829|nr:DUF6328 family protein [Streptomyces sp. NBC_00190]WSZ38402.1 DUF6328 family protein [Streptomyces sp. NBC_00868]